MLQICHPIPPATLHPHVAAPMKRPQTMSTPANAPSAPNPAEDAGVLPEFSHLKIHDAPSPPEKGELDVMTMSRETAMKIVMRAMLSLANSAGEIPATPPLSRPGTPLAKENVAGLIRGHRRVASRPATPIPSERQRTQKTELEQAEASHDEPTITHDIGAGAEPESVQRANMARKFFSKSVPKFGLDDYLNRIQHYCPFSTGVWLAAGSYILQLCVVDKSVPLTHRTMHRLILACLTVAMKTLEDHRWPQKRLAGVGGVDDVALSRLELCVEFLLSFKVQIFTPERMRHLTISLQQAGHAASATSSKLPPSFDLKLPFNPKLRR